MSCTRTSHVDGQDGPHEKRAECDGCDDRGAYVRPDAG